MATAQLVDRVAGDPSPILYTANSPVIQKMDKGFQLIAYCDVRLTGTLTLAGYTAPPTKLVEAVENLVAGITVSATGKGSMANIGAVKSVDLSYLYFMSTMLEGTPLPRTDVDTNNSAYTFETNARIYFALPPKARRIATLTPSELYYCHLFDARFVTNLLLTTQFRDQTAMVTGGTGGTATLSSVQLTVQVRELTGFPSNRANGTPIIRPYVKESQLLFDVTATQLQKQYKDLPVGNLYRRITFKGTVGANPYSDPADTPFNYTGTGRADGPHITLKENLSYTFLDVIYQQLRAANKTTFGVENLPAGYALWDPGSGRNTAGLQRMDLFVDTNFTNSSTNEIQATIQEVVR